MKHIRDALLACISLLLLATPVFAQPFMKGAGLIVGAIWCGAWCSILVLFLTIVYLFLASMQRALNRVSPHNRLMRPRMVWLNLIPGLHLVWQFVLAIRVTDSLKNEFRDRGRDNGSDYGKLLGVAHCISTSLYVVPLLIIEILDLNDRRPVQGPSATATAIGVGFTTFQIVALVSGILFWVKIARYSKQLAGNESARLKRLDAPDDVDAPPAYPEQ